VGACISKPGASPQPPSHQPPSLTASPERCEPTAALPGAGTASGWAGLPRKAPAQAPAVAEPVQLRWPDGRLSTGRLETTPSGQQRFHPDADGEVLAERFTNKPWMKASAWAPPRPLDVSTLAGHGGALVAAQLPSLHGLATVRQHGLQFPVASSADGPTYAVQRADLVRIVTSVGGQDASMTAPQRLAARRLLGDVVDAIADRCFDPQAARQAAAALTQAPWVQVHLRTEADSIQSLSAQDVAGRSEFSFGRRRPPPNGCRSWRSARI
jgi:hypothetical protein